MIYEIEENNIDNFYEKITKYIKEENKKKKKKEDYKIIKEKEDINENLIKIIIKFIKNEEWVNNCLYKNKIKDNEYENINIEVNKKFYILIYNFNTRYFIQVNGNLKFLHCYLNNLSINKYEISSSQSFKHINFNNWDEFLNNFNLKTLKKSDEKLYKEIISIYPKNDLVKLDCSNYFKKINIVNLDKIIEINFNYNHYNEGMFIEKTCAKNSSNLINIDNKNLYDKKDDNEPIHEIADMVKINNSNMFINIKKIYSIKVPNKKNKIKNFDDISKLILQSFFGYKKYKENETQINEKLGLNSSIEEYTFCIIKNEDYNLSPTLKQYLGFAVYFLLKLHPNLKINLCYVKIDDLWINNFIENHLV